MDKWADYLISEVSYDAEHLISIAIRHQDTDQGITKGKPVDRLTISSDIKNGISYITIYSGKNSWKKGHKIQTFSIGGEPFLRIDGNKVKLDHLGDLPNVSDLELLELDLAPEPVTEEPEPTPPSLRGSLPKESTEELPQELDLAPEPVTEPEPEEEEATPEQLARLKQLEKQIQELESAPEPEPEEEEATPEQLARLKQLEKQIQELESAPEPTPPTPPSLRGSLPKESTEDVFEEIEHATEPIPEPEEATPEQFEQLDELQKQINELETKLSNKPVPKIQSEHEEEIPLEQHSEFDDLQDQINELEDELISKLHPSSDEPTQEQISKVNELEKEIEKLEAADIEHEIIQTLQKQNKKLDDIEKKLKLSTEKTPKPSSPEAYCVKCRAKRKIKNPEETIMKNGRPAIKGTCSTCNCKVFRIGKMKK